MAFVLDDAAYFSKVHSFDSCVAYLHIPELASANINIAPNLEYFIEWLLAQLGESHSTCLVSVFLVKLSSLVFSLF